MRISSVGFTIHTETKDILTMRTYALWGKDKRVLGAVLTLGFVLIGVAAVSFLITVLTHPWMTEACLVVVGTCGPARSLEH